MVWSSVRFEAVPLAAVCLHFSHSQGADTGRAGATHCAAIHITCDKIDLCSSPFTK